MNVLIADIMKGVLSGLPYFDKTAGLVQTITKEDNSVSGAKPSVLRFPVEVNLAAGNLTPMIPDESITGMFYVEDGGTRSSGVNDFTSDLTLICWFNPGKISADVNAVSAHAIRDIQNLLCRPYHNISPVSRLKFTTVNIAERSESIFSKYNYSQTQTQFLMPPFDFFAIHFKAAYRLSDVCLTPLSPAEPC